MPSRTSIILCADDYAMSAGVSRGIVALAAAGRISATSVMAHSPVWPDAADALRGVADRVAVGLHLTLTWGQPLGPMPLFARGGTLPPLRQVVLSALGGRLPMAEIRDEIVRQLDGFESVWGGPPAFIDGHQHVHALPGIRAALLAAAAERHLGATTWLRDPTDALAAILRRGGAWPKALVVAVLARGFGAAARRAGFRTNAGFAGFSRFAPDGDVGAEFRRYVVAPGQRHLVMCHPGEVAEDEVLDGVVEPRRREQAYLGTGAFSATLGRAGLSLEPRLPSR